MARCSPTNSKLIARVESVWACLAWISFGHRNDAATQLVASELCRLLESVRSPKIGQLRDCVLHALKLGSEQRVLLAIATVELRNESVNIWSLGTRFHALKNGVLLFGESRSESGLSIRGFEALSLTDEGSSECTTYSIEVPATSFDSLVVTDFHSYERDEISAQKLNSAPGSVDHLRNNLDGLVSAHDGSILLVQA